MIIRTTLSLMALATLGLATINDYEYNYEEYDIGDDESNHEEVDKEVNYEQVSSLIGFEHRASTSTLSEYHYQ